MRRREFITLASSAAAIWPVVLRAQPQPKMLRVGFVGIQPREFAIYAAFLERMAELSYEEGRNFAFEYIQAANVDAYEKSYLELAARKVDVFLAVGKPALRAALSEAFGRRPHSRCSWAPPSSAGIRNPSQRRPFDDIRGMSGLRITSGHSRGTVVSLRSANSRLLLHSGTPAIRKPSAHLARSSTRRSG